MPGGTATTTSSPRAPWRWLPGTVPAAARALMWREAQRREIAARGVADEHDVAAAPAVAAIGAAARHVGLAAERDRAVAAGPAFDVDLRPVVEHRIER